MKNIYTLFFKSTAACFISISLLAQPVLKPSIGLSALPPDNTPICNIQCSSTGWNFETDGFLVGDTIPQFKLYKLNGDSVDALTQLLTGKPLLLINGSYTCPVFMGKIPDINNLVSTYGSQINIFVTYVVEAHPNTPDVSPYSCTVWTTSQNQSAGILYLQPTTYLEKKNIVTAMTNNVTINAPILIDGPCNEYWTNFGHAPNNAYLIRPDNGTVYCKHGWFNDPPNDISTCIDSLLLELTAINDLSSNANKVSIYPNPFSESAMVEVAGLIPSATGYEFNIYDVCGKKARSEHITGSIAEIEKGNLMAGIYFYKVVNGKEITSNGKLIIN